MKNSVFAISIAPSAICVKPKSAASNAIIKNANDQRIILFNVLGY
ncbi:MAG TPA: hypothetical protein VK806_00395 [Bacteroidia bacterium]|nr:hypothetical protein [Bacteroidia bacterium]